LDGVDLVVRPGEVVALLGPNGAGKTTTVEIIEGYRDADAGTARVLGQDPRRGGPALKARVGLMLQGGAGLEPRATPRDLLRLYAAFHLGARSPDELIEQVGLADVAGTRVRRLSGGERQRLSLALALVGNPEVLLLDEPTAGLDPAARRDTRALIASLKGEGRTILLTTHDLGDVEVLADRVAILHDGRIVAEDSPQALESAGDATLRFRLHATPSAAALERLRGRLAAAQPPVGVVPVAASRSAEAPTFAVEPGRASADLVLELAQWAAREGLLVEELRAGATSLEERYLELTGDRAIEAFQ
ncbi:MAG TPA: ABC transporter ATP-binding protein, partial [Candidatus Limnocylindrales bacterium]|nr:ABC transporter ATP-binding protein [Candidatus Limnocylindrales bacterium]